MYEGPPAHHKVIEINPSSHLFKCGGMSPIAACERASILSGESQHQNLQVLCTFQELLVLVLAKRTNWHVYPKKCLRSFQNGNAVKQRNQIQWQKTNSCPRSLARTPSTSAKPADPKFFDLQLWGFKKPCVTACSAENNDDRNDKIYLSQEGLLVCIFQVS